MTTHLEHNYLFACYERDYELAKSFLKKGANIHYKCEEIVANCARYGDVDFMQFLFEQGICFHQHHRAVLASSFHHQLEALMFLGEHGADVISNFEIMACQTRIGSVPIVQYLQSKGANLHFLDDHLFRFSCLQHNIPLAQYLLEQGADIHALQGEVLITLLKSKEQNISTIQFLLDHYQDKSLALSIFEKCHSNLTVEWAKSYLDYSRLDKELDSPLTQDNHKPKI